MSAWVDGTVEDGYRSGVEFAGVDRAKCRAAVQVAEEFRIFVGHVTRRKAAKSNVDIASHGGKRAVAAAMDVGWG